MSLGLRVEGTLNPKPRFHKLLGGFKGCHRDFWVFFEVVGSGLGFSKRSMRDEVLGALNI